MNNSNIFLKSAIKNLISLLFLHPVTKNDKRCNSSVKSQSHGIYPKLISSREIFFKLMPALFTSHRGQID